MEQVEGRTAGQERRQAPGDDPRWAETWHFDLATPDARLGAFVRVVLLPHRRTCWYWAWVVGEGRPPVMVVDPEVPLPPGRTLELRTEGLWADHTVEVPFDHVTLGCEAFALRLDDPRDALAPDPVGDRVPFGLDLEWDTAGPVRSLPPADAAAAGDPADPGTSAAAGMTGYEIPCQVHGEVLVADEHLVIDQATGTRHHTWGVADWSTPWTTSAPVGAEPVASAPIRITTPDGRTTHLTRTLVRHPGEVTGTTTAGWIEENAPR